MILHSDCIVKCVFPLHLDRYLADVTAMQNGWWIDECTRYVEVCK